MKITELVRQLETIKADHGDIEALLPEIGFDGTDVPEGFYEIGCVRGYKADNDEKLAVLLREEESGWYKPVTVLFELEGGWGHPTPRKPRG